MTTRWLVIGYGNELRRDDGAGPRVARIVASWQRADVQALAVHQLTPELAVLLADMDHVVFVDAGTTARATVSVRLLAATSRSTTLAHTGDPSELLALTQALHGRQPRAWLLTIPVSDLDFGEDLSAPAQQGVEEALQRIRTMTMAQPCTKPA